MTVNRTVAPHVEKWASKTFRTKACTCVKYHLVTSFMTPVRLQQLRGFISRNVSEINRWGSNILAHFESHSQKKERNQSNFPLRVTCWPLFLSRGFHFMLKTQQLLSQLVTVCSLSQGLISLSSVWIAAQNIYIKASNRWMGHERFSWIYNRLTERL